MQPIQQRLRPRVELILIQEKIERSARFAPDINILGDSQMVHQVEFLVNNADAEQLRSSRRRDFDFLALDKNTSCVLGIDSRQHFHQRGLASAVFAYEGMYLAGIQFKLALT